MASSGLESYATHGFLRNAHPSKEVEPIVDFVRGSLSTYSRSALPFVADTHETIERHLNQRDGDTLDDRVPSTLQDIVAIDELYEAMTLNHVTRRASTSQGVALLTLYSKGFAQSRRPLDGCNASTSQVFFARLIDQMKLSVRRDFMPGHLPVCWGILTAALGLSLGEFLQ